MTEAEIRGAFDIAVKRCKYLPQIAELREFAEESNIQRHRAKAAEMNRQLLNRADKPEEFSFKLEDARDEIERRELEQEQRDLAYPETDTDADWPKLQRGNTPKDEWYVSYLRRKEARKRAALGIPLVPARIRLGSMLANIVKKG